MSLKTEKSLHLLGFLAANQVPREAFMSGTYAVVAEGGNRKAQQALSAFIRGLYERDAVGLARYVRAEGNPPKLGVLLPRIKTAYESLLFIALPFAEDCRRYLFAPFLEKAQLTEEQESAVQDWIAAMSLMSAARDEDNQPMEALRPGDTHNILFAHHHAAVQQRVLKPDEPLPATDPALLQHLSTPEEVLIAAEPALEQLKQLFPLRRRAQMPQQSRLAMISRLWSGDTDLEAGVFTAGTAAAEAATDAEAVATDVTISTATATATANDKPNQPPLPDVPRSLNPTNPIPDFLAMINAKHVDLVQPALMLLMALIPKYVASGKHDLAFECFVQLREASLRVSVHPRC